MLFKNNNDFKQKQINMGKSCKMLRDCCAAIFSCNLHNNIAKNDTAFSFTLQWVLIVDVELPWRGCTMLNRSERNLRYLCPLNYGFGDAVL